MIDPQTLFSESACLDCYGMPSLAGLLKLALLQRIAESVSTTTIQVYAGRYPAAPDDTSLAAIDFDGVGTQRNWYAGSWH